MEAKPTPWLLASSYGSNPIKKMGDTSFMTPKANSAYLLSSAKDV